MKRILMLATLLTLGGCKAMHGTLHGPARGCALRVSLAASRADSLQMLSTAPKGYSVDCANLIVQDDSYHGREAGDAK